MDPCEQLVKAMDPISLMCKTGESYGPYLTHLIQFQQLPDAYQPQGGWGWRSSPFAEFGQKWILAELVSSTYSANFHTPKLQSVFAIN